MFFNKIKRSIITTICLAIATLMSSVAFSITTAKAADVPDYRLQISPSQANLGEIQPGKTYVGGFQVQNTGSKQISFTVELAPYSVQNENYDPDFTSVNEYTELMDWITLSSREGTIESGDAVDIEYEITVPSDAPGKSQNAAIIVTLVEGSENSTDTGVQAIRQASFLLYSNVAGETRAAGAVISNNIPSFIFAPPIVATSTVENTGNIFTTAKYHLVVKNFFGDSIAYDSDGEKTGQIVFPETSRYNEIAWEGAPHLGIFKVSQTVSIFDQESTVEKIVFLCPIWFLVLIIAIIAVAIFWIVSRILKRRQ